MTTFLVKSSLKQKNGSERILKYIYIYIYMCVCVCDMGEGERQMDT